MRIITIQPPAVKLPVRTKAELEAEAIFTLTLTERDIAGAHDPFNEWAGRRTGLCDKGRWRRQGEGEQPRTATFKWVEVAGEKTFAELTAELRKHGAIPLAEWCAAIPRMPREERPFPCAVADASWTHTNGERVIACVYANGVADLLPAEEGDYTGWRWLVEV